MAGLFIFICVWFLYILAILNSLSLEKGLHIFYHFVPSVDFFFFLTKQISSISLDIFNDSAEK